VGPIAAGFVAKVEKLRATKIDKEPSRDETVLLLKAVRG
jgi:hypothetical protein